MSVLNGQKIKNSQSSHAKFATPANCQAFRDAWLAIPREMRLAVFKAWPRKDSNDKGQIVPISAITGYVEPMVLHGLTADFPANMVSGYDWTHDDFEQIINLLRDENTPIKAKIELARQFADVPDHAKSDKSTVKLLINGLGIFNAAELQQIFGKDNAPKPIQTTPRSQEEIVNAMPIDSLIGLLAKKLGIAESDVKALVELGKAQPVEPSPVKADNAAMLKAAKVKA